MSGDRDISYEEYIPTDRFTVQDMYFWGIQQLRTDYAKVMRGWYNGRNTDRRALIDFLADADGFYWFALENMKRHLDQKERDALVAIFERERPADVKECRLAFQIFMRFAAKSKLTDLSETRVLGTFARARASLGIGTERKAGAEE